MSFPHHLGATLDFPPNTVKTHLQLSSHMNSVRNYGDRVFCLQFAEPIHVKYISWSPHQSKNSFLVAVPLLTLPLETEGFCFCFFSLKALFPSTVNGIVKLSWNVVFMFMWIILWNLPLRSYRKSKARDPRRFLNSARVQKEHVTVSRHDGMCTATHTHTQLPSPTLLPCSFSPLASILFLTFPVSPVPAQADFIAHRTTVTSERVSCTSLHPSSTLPPSCPSLIILLQKQI